MSIQVPISPCPDCGASLDAVSYLWNEAHPNPGDYSVCAYCGQLLRFVTDLMVEAATPSEVSEDSGLTEEQASALLSARRVVLRRRPK